MNFWDEKYAGRDFVYGVQPNDFLRTVAHHIPKGRVLCLAEGEGRNAVHLAELGYDVLAVDQSLVGLDKAKHLAAERGVQIETVVADLSDFEFPPQSYSGIVSIWCHLPATLRKRVHATCVSSLALGGVFILEAYTPAQLKFGTGGPPVSELMMNRVDVQAELQGMEFLLAQEVERQIEEGHGHQGHSATVQVLARRAAGTLSAP